MPILNSSDYCPSLLHRNGHLATLIPYFTAKRLKLNLKRLRIQTPDRDFLDLDCLERGSHRLVILSHGLEGNSSSWYISYFTQYFYSRGYDVVAWNYRGCSGEINKNPRMYHSGATDDLNVVLDHVAWKYKSISLVGFSLGGNLTLKYLSEPESGFFTNIRCGIAISTPCDLSGCADQMARVENFLYRMRFLYSLSKKIKLKHRQFPDKIDVGLLKEITTIREFDEYYTAPIHGFQNAEDYYEKSSSLYVLHKIKIPALIINAKDDPFLHINCFPFDIAKSSNLVHLLAPVFGGHVGFQGLGNNLNWSAQKALEFSQLNILG